MTSIDSDSTLIRRAKHVDTVQEFAEFADTLERRPITKLLGELPALAKISKIQFMMATRVMRRRYSQQPTGEQFELQSVGLDIAAEVHDAETSAQIRSVFTGDDSTFRRGNTN